MRFHGVVVLHGGAVGAVDDHLGPVQCGLGFTLEGVDLRVGAEFFGAVQGRVPVGQEYVVFFGLLLYTYQGSGVAGFLRGVGDHRGHDLPTKTDVGVLEHGELTVVGGGKAFGAVVREDGAYPGQVQST